MPLSVQSSGGAKRAPMRYNSEEVKLMENYIKEEREDIFDLVCEMAELTGYRRTETGVRGKLREYELV